VPQQQPHDPHLAGGGGGVDAAVGHPDLAAAEGRVGAVREQLLAQREVDAAPLLLKVERQVQRGPALLVAHVWIGAVREQQLDHRRARLLGVQRQV